MMQMLSFLPGSKNWKLKAQAKIVETSSGR